jgi:hypothetical protein
MYPTENEKLAEQDEKIFIKGVIIATISAFLFWVPFYLINK